MDKCYANHLGSCSDKISKEHYISEALLKEINNLEVSGFKWLKGETKKLPTAALTSKILCTNHNSKLSGLDAQIVNIFKEFKEFSDTSLVPLKNIKRNIDAKSFEKWMLKVLCGMIASGNASKEDGIEIDFEIPSLWIDLLFSDDPLPKEIGLYFKSIISLQFEAKDQFGFAPITEKESDRIIGCKLDFRGFPFYFFLEEVNDKNYLPKPTKITMKKGKFKEVLHFFY